MSGETNNYKGFEGTRETNQQDCRLIRPRHYNIAVRPAITISSRRKPLKIALIVCSVCLTLKPLATAQHFAADASSPTEAAKPTPVAHPSQTDSPHPFWDRTNVALFSGVAVTRAMDYASTRNFEARGRQEILLPEDVVHNSAAFASIEAAATMTSVGISYLFHRTGHHKLERWMSIGHINVTAFGDVRNYSLESRHP